MAYKVGSNTVINDSGKLAGIGLIDGINISGTPESGSALVYNGSEWVAGAGGKTVMKIFATTAANASANPTQWAASATGANYEVTTDSLLAGVRAEHIVWKLNDTQIANVALANYTEGTVSGDDTVQRTRLVIDLSTSPALTSVGNQNVIKAYAIDGVNNQSNTITVATTEIVAPGIAKPTLGSPANNATGQAFSPTLTTSAYSVIGHDEAHASTDWQVATDPNFASGFVVNVTANTTSKTSFAIPAGTITQATTAYYWRARYKSATYTSPYMAEGKFTTLAAVGTNGQPYGGGVIANNGVSVVYAGASAGAGVGSSTITLPEVQYMTVSMVGGGASGGNAEQPAFGGGGGGAVRAVFERDPTVTTATVVAGAGSSSASGQNSSFTYNGNSLIAGGGTNPAPTDSDPAPGGAVTSPGIFTDKRTATGGNGGDHNTNAQPGGAGGGAGGNSWSGPAPGSSGGQGTGWYGGGGGGGGGCAYPGNFGSATAAGSGSALGPGFAGGAGSASASPGQNGGGPSGGTGGPGAGSGTPAHAGGGGGGSYGGGGGYTAGWFGSRPGGAGGYVRIDWATGETT